MTKDAPETETPDASQDEAPQMFDAAYVKKLRDEAAKYRTEAKANAAAASKLAELEASSKSEAERVSERIAKLEADNRDATMRALRADIAVEFGIGKEDRDLFLLGADEDTLRAQAKRLADRTQAERANGLHVPAEGRAINPTADSDARVMLDGFFGKR